jgi:hypothetical protein
MIWLMRMAAAEAVGLIFAVDLLELADVYAAMDPAFEDAVRDLLGSIADTASELFGNIGDFIRLSEFPFEPALVPVNSIPGWLVCRRCSIRSSSAR